MRLQKVSSFDLIIECISINLSLSDYGLSNDIAFSLRCLNFSLPSTVSVEETIVSNEDYGDGGFDPWNDFILEEVRIVKTLGVIGTNIFFDLTFIYYFDRSCTCIICNRGDKIV